MKFLLHKNGVGGFTVWDLLIVLATTALLVLILPMFLMRPHPRAKPQRIRCVNNLKQIGYAFRMWAEAHTQQFPTTVSTNKGGSLELAGAGDVLRHYLALSNELNSPKILTCAADKTRKPAADLATVRQSDLSYFVGVDAIATQPQMILSGDRNISTNNRIISGILPLTGKTPVSWTKDIHAQVGNVGLADGSVQQVTPSALNRQILSSPNLPERLAIP